MTIDAKLYRPIKMKRKPRKEEPMAIVEMKPNVRLIDVSYTTEATLREGIAFTLSHEDVLPVRTPGTDRWFLADRGTYRITSINGNRVIATRKGKRFEIDPRSLV